MNIKEFEDYGIEIPNQTKISRDDGIEMGRIFFSEEYNSIIGLRYGRITKNEMLKSLDFMLDLSEKHQVKYVINDFRYATINPNDYYTYLKSVWRPRLTNSTVVNSIMLFKSDIIWKVSADLYLRFLGKSNTNPKTLFFFNIIDLLKHTKV